MRIEAPTSQGSLTGPRGSVWDKEGCALLLIDYQEDVLAEIPEAVRAIVERNVCAIAAAALELDVPVIVSTVGVEIGMSRRTIPSLLAALPDAEPIDRSCVNAWDDLAVLEAVEAIGRRIWVMAGIVTSVGLTYPALCALADGHDVCFIEDAVADITHPFHQAAVARLVRAGAVPRSTQALISGWADTHRRLCQDPTEIAESHASRGGRRAAYGGRESRRSYDAGPRRP
jgi:nicotinamidase-related amidase